MQFLHVHGLQRQPAPVAQPQFEEAFSFFEGLAAVKFDGKWGYVDKNAKYTIQPQFDEAGSFENGLAPVCLGERWGYINKDGKLIWNPTN